MLDGFLNIDKPSGCTSRDVVNRVQRLVKPAKTGHAGTLDPLANGVLVVAVGQATRLIESVQGGVKGYRGEFRLGCISDTEDAQGEVTELPTAPIPERRQLAQACAALVGETQQTPPRYSALKVDGKRAYRLARRGVHVEMKPRTVRIDRCDLLEFEYPGFTLDIACGGGTYVRSIGRDIGEAVGSGAIMTALTRTRVGPYQLKGSIQLEQLSRESIGDLLLPMQSALPDMPQIELSDQEFGALHNGLRISNRFNLGDGETAAGLSRAGRLVSLVTLASNGEVRPIRNFPVSN